MPIVLVYYIMPRQDDVVKGATTSSSGSGARTGHSMMSLAASRVEGVGSSTGLAGTTTSLNQGLSSTESVTSVSSAASIPSNSVSE